MEFFTSPWLGTPLWMWLAFIGIVAALLALDLGVLHRKQREICACGAAGVHRLENLRRRCAGLGEDTAPASLSVTFAILAAGVGWSLWKTRGQRALHTLPASL